MIVASARVLFVALVLFGLALPNAAVGQGTTPGPPGPQRRELVGYIRDPSGAPIEGARVEIVGESALSNEKGLFRLWTRNIDTVTIMVKRLGFAPIEAQLTARNKQWDSVYVELEPTVQTLGGMIVTTSPTTRERWMSEFEERRSKGLGVFLTRDEIAARNTTRLSDILRDRRGIQVVHLSTGSYGVRFVTHSGGRGLACQPDMWLDGVRARGMELDEIFASTVEALELYDTFATVPLQFTHQANTVPCGTIVVWTRAPGRANRETKKPPA